MSVINYVIIHHLCLSLAVVYLVLCVLMLSFHVQQSSIEPVEFKRGQSSMFRGGRNPKEVFPIRVEEINHMTTLLRSPMFTEQGIKLKWIGERIDRLVISDV